MAEQCHIAIDLGAESGRVVVGVHAGSTLELVEMHRFPNQGISLLGCFYWDVLCLFNEIKIGISAACQRFGRNLVSLGVDTWGCDYGLLDGQGQLVGHPFCYRDPRTQGMMDAAFKRMPRSELYRNTGIQLMPFNSVFQLLSEVLGESPLLKIADKLLFMPDLLNYWLSGETVWEYTIASTSQLMDMQSGCWSKAVCEKLSLPSQLLGPIIQPGTELGCLVPEVAKQAGAHDSIQVIAVGGHDTASAVAAVPTEHENYAYISSGTWSLMGIESTEPMINAESYDIGLTNEGGVCGTIRLLKNITGMWLLQQCRRQWAGEGDVLDYDQMTSLASEAPALVAAVDPDHEDFVAPGNMPERISRYCRVTGQHEPKSKGEILRAALEGLALKCRYVLEQLDQIRGQRIDVLNIVGGATRNRLLNQLTADATGRRVIAGPVEATAAGNILMQMIATGGLDSLQAGRALVRRSFPTETYEPSQAGGWEVAYGKFKSRLDNPG